MLCSKTLVGSVKIRDPSGAIGRLLLWHLFSFGIILLFLRYDADSLLMTFIFITDLELCEEADITASQSSLPQQGQYDEGIILLGK